jgi:uncharacterized protein YdeI (YjbR/CyaY-like superfamily)
MLCSMAAFKQHAAFGFWKGPLILGRGKDIDAMGQFGRLTAVSDLPARNVLIGYVKQAAALNDQGVKVARPPRRAAPKTLRVPAELASALKKNKKAQAAFEDFPPSHKRDYIEWITEAKAAATRARRLQQAIEWIADGKSRNWKYQTKNRA